MRRRIPIVEVASVADGLLDHRMDQHGLRKFECVQTAEKRQAMMLARLARFGFGQDAELLASDCRGRDCDLRACRAACHFASRLHRAEIIWSESEFFGSLPGPVQFFTVVHSVCRVKHRKLAKYDPGPAAKLVSGVLRSCGALGSFNIEVVLCEEGGETYWAPHVHGLAAGPTRKALSRALRELTVDDANFRPVVVKTIPTAHAPVLLNYMTKRVDSRKIRYVRGDGKQRWRLLPMRPKDQATLDAWRCARSVDALHFRVGFKRNGRFLICT